VISNIAELNAVYPRWRGELTNAAHQGVSSSGLSPLARGTLNQVVVLSAAGRFIPAGAGNSSPTFSPFRPAAVYPRWRGELARGERRHARGDRFIPAGAGNSAIQAPDYRQISVYPRWRGELNASSLI